MRRWLKNSRAVNIKNGAILTIGLLILGLFFSSDAFAGPITNGPGVAPYTKLGVYQGVISVIPGGTGDSVMEIGNDGRDIATTGDLYMRSHSISDPNLLAMFTEAWGGTSLKLSAQPNQPSLIISSNNTWSNPNNSLIFMAGQLNAGGWNALSEAGDAGIFYRDTTGFVIGPWAQTAPLNRGLRIASNGNLYIGASASLCFSDGTCRNTWSGIGGASSLDTVLAIGNKSNHDIILGQGTDLASGVALVDVIQPNNSLDAISTKSNSTTKSAIYAQNNAGGFAGYFSGTLDVEEGAIVLNDISKDRWRIEVCQVGVSGGCLGQYLYTDTSLGTTLDKIRYCYDIDGNQTPTCENAFQVVTSITCQDGFHEVSRGTSIGYISYYTDECMGDFEYVLGSTPPYGIGSACKAYVQTANVTVKYRQNIDYPACSAVDITQSFYRIRPPIPSNSYIAVLELR